MKKLLMLAFAAVTLGAFAAENAEANASAALVAARAKIQGAAQDKKVMTAVMKTLSAADQLKFVSEVMGAISKLPGSPEEHTAMYLNATRGAIEGAAKGNVTEVVAEAYAVVPVGSLPVITESLAENVFNRAANPKVTYTDERFIKIVENVMKTVNARLETAEDGGVRAGFAALMMVKASNSATPEIQKAAVATLPESVREKASNEWFPAALASSENKSYEPMLGVADGDVSRPVVEMVLRIAGPQTFESVLADLSGANTDKLLTAGEANPVVDAVQSPIVYELPNLGNGGVNAVVPSKQEAEPGGYQYQTTGI